MARRVIPAAASIAAVAISWCLTGAAQADVLPPEPSTFWREQEAPSSQSLAIAGVCLSAAAIAIGLLVTRIGPLRTRAATLLVAAVTLVAVGGIAVAAWRFQRQADRDRQAWKEYREAVKNRRWTPPPQFRDGPPPPQSPPPAASSSSQ